MEDNKIDSYKEILEVLNKHKDLLKEDHSTNIIDRIKDRITLLEISKDFGIAINPDCRPDWCKLSEHAYIALFGSKHNRTITWSDDGSQPENERLYQISFPTGAYVFSEAYPKETFAEFFSELRSYKPKYIDSANKCLYFTSEEARHIHEDFKDIFDKYKKLVREELKAKEITSLKERLKKLEKPKEAVNDTE